MTRRRVPLIVLISAVLLVGTVAIWAWSYPNWTAFAHRGCLVVVFMQPDGGTSYPRFADAVEESAAVRGERLWEIANASDDWRGGVGFWVSRGQMSLNLGDVHGTFFSAWLTFVAVPFWFIVLVLATPLVVWTFRSWRRQRRTKHSLCANCGYDLRATTGRCPECGVARQDMAADQ